MKNLLLLLVAILLFVSCSKNNVKQELPDQYIKAQFGEENIIYERGTVACEYLFRDDSSTSFVIDQLGLVTNSIGNQRGIQIYVMGSQFRDLNFPVNIGVLENALVDLQLIEYNSPADTVFGINDDWNYSGVLNNFLIEKYDTQGYIEGSFSGIISTRTGRLLNVNEGAFRIMITEREINR